MMEDLSQYPLELKGSNIPMVSFMNVSKGYGSLTVLENLNLNIDKGEMVSIIGPSGSGKTTVLRMLMLEKIDKGVIYLDGKPITHMEKDGLLIPATDKYLLNARTQIGMCFQHFNLFPHMTALQNCMEGLVQVLGMSKNDAKNRSEELLEMVGVIDKKDQHPSRFIGWSAAACCNRTCFGNET
jgi:polar amino acid transport system ATP-binding protein